MSRLTIGSSCLSSSETLYRDTCPFLNEDRGYIRCTLTPQEWRTDYRVVKVVNEPAFQPAVTLATFATEAGNPGAQLDSSAPTTAQAQETTPDIQRLERDRIAGQQQSGR